MTTQMNSFIFLDGNAKEAIRFYEGALDAKVVFQQTFGEAPDSHESSLTAEGKERLAHSVLKVGGADFFVADTVPGTPSVGGNRVNICITTDDIETSKRYFDSLQQGGEVNFPLQKVHFSPAYGIVTDKFGVMFQIFTARNKS
jgi:PhnB protein